MISINEACHYVGADHTDEDDRNLVERSLKQAYERLLLLTGTDWRQRDSNIADDTVCAMVYVSYYAIRDDTKNTEFLERKIASDITFLQFAGSGEDGS